MSAPVTDAVVPAPSIVTTGLVVASVLFPVISFVAIVLRFKARKISRQPFNADDWWIVVSWITAFGLSIIVWVIGASIGVNHLRVGPVEGISGMLKVVWGCTLLVNAPLAAVKISILLFYKRIFNTPKFGAVAWFSIAAVACWGTIFFFLCLTLEDPISGSWTGQGRLRYDSTAVGYAQVGSSIGLDLAVLFLPLPVISSLHMKSGRKVAVMLIFWLGAFCVVAATVRLYFLHQSIQYVLSSPGFSAIAVQWKNMIFMIIEPHCSIIAGCLPCFGPLVRGGRRPESLIRSLRSIRSVFSLRTGSSSRGRSNASSGYTYSSDGMSPLKTKPSKEWPTHPDHGVTTVHVSREPNMKDVEAGIDSEKKIKVTKDVEVTRV